MNKKKYRMRSWYWGNYATKVKDNIYRDDRDISLHISDKDMEEYLEKDHGWHHSEEYKLNGKPRWNHENR